MPQTEWTRVAHFVPAAEYWLHNAHQAVQHSQHANLFRVRHGLSSVIYAADLRNSVLPNFYVSSASIIDYAAVAVHKFY